MSKFLIILIAILLLSVKTKADEVKIEKVFESHIVFKTKNNLILLKKENQVELNTSMQKLSKEHCGENNSYVFTKNTSKGLLPDYYATHNWKYYIYLCGKDVFEAIKVHQNLTKNEWNGTLTRSSADCTVCGLPDSYLEITATDSKTVLYRKLTGKTYVQN